MDAQNKVTVIGLGQMGFTLARLLLKQNYKVTVWNRSASKAAALVKEGAILAEDVIIAIKSSPIVVVCVIDYEASDSVLKYPQVANEISGRTIIQLTTGSPDEATASELWAHKFGAAYIDGAIQVAPEQMAKPDTTIFVSGSQKAYDQAAAILNIFGGNIKYLGNRISAAAAMDLASLSYLYGSLLGFFHAARIAESEGFSMDMLGEIITEVSPGFADFMKYEAGVINSGDFGVTQSPLSISIEATERILKASEQYKINTEVPKLAASFFSRANKAGYGREELASLIKVFRNS